MSALELELDSIAAETSVSSVGRVDRADRIEIAKAYGLAHRGYEIANEVEARYAIANGALDVTALTVVSLVDDGLLELSEAVDCSRGRRARPPARVPQPQ